MCIAGSIILHDGKQFVNAKLLQISGQKQAWVGAQEIAGKLSESQNLD